MKISLGVELKIKSTQSSLNDDVPRISKVQVYADVKDVNPVWSDQIRWKTLKTNSNTVNVCVQSRVLISLPIFHVHICHLHYTFSLQNFLYVFISVATTNWYASIYFWLRHRSSWQSVHFQRWVTPISRVQSFEYIWMIVQSKQIRNFLMLPPRWCANPVWM